MEKGGEGVEGGSVGEVLLLLVQSTNLLLPIHKTSTMTHSLQGEFIPFNFSRPKLL